jgi:hypothetical protein
MRGQFLPLPAARNGLAHPRPPPPPPPTPASHRSLGARTEGSTRTQRCGSMSTWPRTQAAKAVYVPHGLCGGIDRPVAPTGDSRGGAHRVGEAQGQRGPSQPAGAQPCNSTQPAPCRAQQGRVHANPQRCRWTCTRPRAYDTGLHSPAPAPTPKHAHPSSTHTHRHSAQIASTSEESWMVLSRECVGVRTVPAVTTIDATVVKEGAGDGGRRGGTRGMETQRHRVGIRGAGASSPCRSTGTCTHASVSCGHQERGLPATRGGRVGGGRTAVVRNETHHGQQTVSPLACIW